MELIPWVWAMLALFFLAAEIFTAGFVLLCFGIGAAIASALAFWGFNLTWQLAGFVAASALAVVLSRPFANRVSSLEKNTVGIDRVLGKRATVIVAINPDLAHGRIRVDREEWLADSVDGAPIEVGAKVEVMGVEGTRLQVRRLPA